MDLGWLRENIGAVSQDPTLFAGTIAENIAYAKPNATRAEIVAAAEACKHEFVERFPDGYDTLVGERGALLSGGQHESPSPGSSSLTRGSCSWTKPRARWTRRARRQCRRRSARREGTDDCRHRTQTRDGAARAPGRRAHRRETGGVRHARGAHAKEGWDVRGARQDADRGVGDEGTRVRRARRGFVFDNKGSHFSTTPSGNRLRMRTLIY